MDANVLGALLLALMFLGGGLCIYTHTNSYKSRKSRKSH